VAHVDQVSGGLIGAIFVHAGDGVATPAIGKAVDVDDGCTGLAVGFCHDGRSVDVGGHDDEAGWQVGLQFAKVDFLFAEVVVGVAEEKSQTVAEGGIFCTLDHGGEERVRNIRDDHGDDVCLIATKAACQLIGLIAERLDGRHDPFPVDFTNRRQAAQHVGDGSKGDVGESRDLLHVCQATITPRFSDSLTPPSIEHYRAGMKAFKVIENVRFLDGMIGWFVQEKLCLPH